MSAGATKKPGKNKKYRGWYRNMAGDRVFFTGTYDRATTLEGAKQLEGQHTLWAAGAPMPKTAAKHKGRAFDDTVTEYLAWGRSQGGLRGGAWGKDHARKVEATLAWWGKRLNLATLGDLQDGLRAKAEAALRDLGVSNKTRSGYSGMLAAFCAWAAERQYLDGNPAQGLCQYDKTVKNLHRGLSGDEVSRLLAGCDPARRLLYATAAGTGLRRGELAALKVGDLDTEKGGLRVHGEWAKDRRDAFQPTASWIIQELSAVAQKQGLSALFQTLSNGDTNYA